ncbi:MAG: DNA starvation/stationary phase protection protein [Miniphocaeibacter sp.]|uniref:Dps family protein n=1 Tax=Miniphocaeibacter sp. TaxID=3100973 RepID=UPI001800A6EC|nr:DNA starvation/stationary phase protection protein [Gallicola sp.]
MKKLNVYLSNLNIEITKVHNLHWNIAGNGFINIHNFTEEFYNDLFEKFDEIAELIKMRKEFPLASVKDYLENSTIKEIESKDYKKDEVLNILLDDINTLRDLAVEIRQEADEKGDFILVSALEDHISGYDKNIWMISAMLK